MSIIITIIELIIILSVVALVHEFGHFIVAKLFKMTVNEFSIGFGKPIWQKKIKDTIYSFRIILLGGYVAIEGEDTETEDANAFYKKPEWQRILVLIAGVAMNFILAIIILLSINFSSDTLTTKITALEEGSILTEAGISVGDKITKIGNSKMHIYADIALFSDTSNKDIEVEYISNGEIKTAILESAVTQKGLLGVYFDTSKITDDGALLPIIDMVSPGSRAETAGIKSGDKILEVDGIIVNTSSDVINIVSKKPEVEVKLKIERKSEEIEITLIPEATDYINFGIADVEVVSTDLRYSWYKSVNTVLQVINSYVDLFKGKVKLTQMSGIVGVGEMVSKTDSFMELISLVATLSLAIGMANIMPFPPLDGGKVVLVLVEWISRKKVSTKVENTLSLVGFALLILLTIFVTIKDIIRVI